MQLGRKQKAKVLKRYDKTFKNLINKKKRDYVYLDKSMVKFLTFKTLATKKKGIDAYLEAKVDKILTFKAFISLYVFPSPSPK